MTRMDVLVPAFSIAADSAAIEIGARLAADHGGEAAALIVGVSLGSEYAELQNTLSVALADIIAGADSAAAKARRELVEWIAARQPGMPVFDATIEAAAALDEIVGHARMADLIVCTRADQYARARSELVQDILFKSARPVLLLPPDARVNEAWRRITIAWNGSASAVRAVSGALPLLQHAESVRIVTIDARQHIARRGEKPGQDLAAYLARRDVEASVHNLDGLGRDHAERLEEAAADHGADLIVMGAYGHSRVREFVLGGVTRSLLARSQFPLLLAH